MAGPNVPNVLEYSQFLDERYIEMFKLHMPNIGVLGWSGVIMNSLFESLRYLFDCVITKSERNISIVAFEFTFITIEGVEIKIEIKFQECSSDIPEIGYIFITVFNRVENAEIIRFIRNKFPKPVWVFKNKKSNMLGISYIFNFLVELHHNSFIAGLSRRIPQYNLQIIYELYDQYIDKYTELQLSTESKWYTSTMMALNHCLCSNDSRIKFSNDGKVFSHMILTSTYRHAKKIQVQLDLVFPEENNTEEADFYCTLDSQRDIKLQNLYSTEFPIGQPKKFYKDNEENNLNNIWCIIHFLCTVHYFL
jgi:hypothetical protein